MNSPLPSINSEAIKICVVTDPSDTPNMAIRLAKLSADTTEMKSYGEEQWQYLLQAGDVTLFIAIRNSADAYSSDTTNNPLLGCVLQIQYDGATITSAYGMMLVHPTARRQGLARKLLTAATTHNNDVKLLAACSPMGRPLYESMGYQRVGTVTKLTANLASIQFPSAMLLDSNHYDQVEISESSPRNLQDFLKLDATATGLDRSKTLTAIQGYSYVKTIVIQRDGLIQIAALLTCHTGATNVMVGPILGDEQLVPNLLQNVQEYYTSASSESTVTELSLIVSNHKSLVDLLRSVGFEINFDLGAMTYAGIPMPGDQDNYLGLIHPTLG